jgi:ketosteroid isomerase-like protein
MTSLREGLVLYYEEMGTLRERSLDRLGDFFAEDVDFHDPFRDTHGLPALRRLFERMFKQYTRVRFSDFRGDGDEHRFTLRYAMEMQMMVGPVFVTDMISVFTVRDGKIVDLYDYYDFASSLVSPFPRLRAAYRGAINALFL